MHLRTLKTDLTERHRANKWERKNEVAQFNTKLSYYVNEYTGLMQRDFEENGIQVR